MKKTKKMLCLLLMLSLIISSLSMAGCTKKEKGPITLDVYSSTANTNGEQRGWFGQIMLEKFNVKLNIVNEAPGRFTTRMESGDLGDIVIFGNSSSNYLQAIDKGLLLDWNEDDLLTDYGPYIKENFTKALEKNIKINPDGKVHGFGAQVATSLSDHGATIYHPDVRYDLYKQIGSPKVSTLEDWVDILAQMKEICPLSDTGKETYPVSLFKDWDDNMVMFVKSTAALYGWDEFGIGLYKNGVWQDCLAEGGMYLRCLKFYNMLYQRNLLNPNSMAQGGDAEAYSAGGAFFNIFSFVGSAQYNTEAHLKEGKAMYPIIMEDQETLMYGLNVTGATSVITIGANTQYPELCMEIINWLSTPEGVMVTSHGPQGVTWDYDENGKSYLTELGLQTKMNGKTEMTGGYSDTYANGMSALNFGTVAGDCINPESGETYNNATWPSYNETLNYGILNEWREFSGYTTIDEYMNANPNVVVPGTDFIMAERGEDLDLQWQQVTNTIKDYSWKAIYAATDEEYDRLVKEMREVADGYGYDSVCEFYTAEAAKRKAAEDLVSK